MYDSHLKSTPQLSFAKPEARRLVIAFGVLLTIFYLAFAPSTATFVGYAEENLTAAEQVTANLLGLLRGQAPTAVAWTHHGFTEVCLQVPFVLLSRLLFGASRIWSGRIIVLQPIIATSVLCTLLLIWVYRLVGNWVWAFWVALLSGVTTMLWPYAYAGMETTQSLFLVVAGYLALGRPSTHTRREIFGFALACAITVSAKMNGIFLLPAVLFLVREYCRDGSERKWYSFPARWKEALFIITVLALMLAANRYARQDYWGQLGGEENYVASLTINSPLSYFINLWGYFGAPNKSLFIYAPLLVLSALTLRRAYQLRRAIVIWALLTLGGMAGALSFLVVWTDETWGPRYLHVTIAPLILCWAVTIQSKNFAWRREKLLAVVAVSGLLISLLGVIFHYGILYLAASRTSTSTIEAIQGDLRFNHLSFNGKLLRVWGRGRLGSATQPEYWPGEPNWWFVRPPDALPTKQVDLRELALPAPVLLRGWNEGSQSSPQLYRTMRFLCGICLLLGLAGLFLLHRSLVRIENNSRGGAIETAEVDLLESKSFLPAK